MPPGPLQPQEKLLLNGAISHSPLHKQSTKTRLSAQLQEAQGGSLSCSRVLSAEVLGLT